MKVIFLEGGGLVPESFKTRLTRWYLNLYPAYRGSGATVTYIASDWAEIHVRIPLSWRTRNIVGTIFGGSLYAAVDPIYMLMLMRRLGPGSIVWDKSAAIQFKKPGRSTLFASFQLNDQEISEIKAILEQQLKLDRIYQVELVDKGGNVHALVEKTIYIRKAGSES